MFSTLRVAFESATCAVTRYALPAPRLRRLYAERVRRQFVDGVGRAIGASNGRYWRTEHALLVEENPDLAFGAWRNTRAARRLRAASAELSRTRTRSKPHALPANVLFCSYKNWQFAQPIVEAFRADLDFAVDTLQGVDIPRPFGMTASNLFPPLHDPRAEAIRFMERFGRGYPSLAAKIEKADVVFVEWANEAAIWMSRILPPSKRLVVRMHGFEAFSPWVHFILWGRVDSLIFVSEHLRAFVDHALDLSAQYPHIQQRVIGNWNDVTSWREEKTQSAQYTLGMAGYATTNKNPLFAVDILRTLVERAPSYPWRLRLVGKPWPDAIGDSSEAAYRGRFEAAVNDPAVSGRISIEPFTGDMADWFRDIGFILSASDRESQHMTVVQGMSSGAVPVVRNWPVGRRWQAAATLYPNALLWNTPGEAAGAILAEVETGRWETTRRRARAEAQDRFDRQTVYRDLRDVLLGGHAPRPES